MYVNHFIETARDFTTSYNIVAEHKKKEVNMETEKLHQSAHNATTIKQSNRPASHLLYNSPTLGLFFLYADT
mgnify:CR=1 FL=1|jgi:hypothetical protein